MTYVGSHERAQKNFIVIYSELKTLSESHPSSDRDLDKEILCWNGFYFHLIFYFFRRYVPAWLKIYETSAFWQNLKPNQFPAAHTDENIPRNH